MESQAKTDREKERWIGGWICLQLSSNHRAPYLLKKLNSHICPFSVSHLPSLIQLKTLSPFFMGLFGFSHSPTSFREREYQIRYTPTFPFLLQLLFFIVTFLCFFLYLPLLFFPCNPKVESPLSDSILDFLGLSFLPNFGFGIVNKLIKTRACLGSWNFFFSPNWHWRLFSGL